MCVIDWCTKEPNVAFSWPHLGSSLSQDVDPPILKASLAHGEHGPSMEYKNMYALKILQNTLEETKTKHAHAHAHALASYIQL